MTEVKSEPGPSTTTSASRIASTAASVACGARGESHTSDRAQGPDPSVASPRNSMPSRVRPHKTTFSIVEGHTLPWQPSISPHSSIASPNEPVSAASEASRRLPSEWLSAKEKRCSKARARGPAGSAAMATRHLRMSPGGTMPISWRMMPVDPPSSAMATMAVTKQPAARRARIALGWPVPPPMETARTWPGSG